MNRRTTTGWCLRCGVKVGRQEYCKACRRIVHGARRDQAFADYGAARAAAAEAGLELRQFYDKGYGYYSHYQLWAGRLVWNLFPGNLYMKPRLPVPVEWRLMDVVEAAARTLVRPGCGKMPDGQSEARVFGPMI